MNQVLDRAGSMLDQMNVLWHSRMGRRRVEPEPLDDSEEEDEGSSAALFFWGILTALALWWLYLRPAAGERRMDTLRAEGPPEWLPEPRPAARRAQAEPVQATTLTATAEEAAEEAQEPDDDLTRILGVGPARATRLREAGIATYAALAMADAEQLRDILTGVGVGVGNADVSSWPKQASLAAKGDWEGLETYQEQLRAERG